MTDFVADREKIEAAILTLKIPAERRFAVPACIDETLTAIYHLFESEPLSSQHPTPKQAREELIKFAAAIEAGQSFETAAMVLSQDSRDLLRKWEWQRSLPAALPWSPPLRKISDPAKAARWIAGRVIGAVGRAGDRRGRKREPNIVRLGKRLAAIYRMATGREAKRVIVVDDATGGQRHGGAFADFVAAVLDAAGLRGSGDWNLVGRIVDNATGFSKKRRAEKRLRAPRK